VQVGSVFATAQEIGPVWFAELSSSVWSSAQDVIGGEDSFNDYQESQGVRFQCSRTESAEEDDVRFGISLSPKEVVQHVKSSHLL
jgi:hypothetical protein